MVEVRRYANASGQDVIGEWLPELHDPRARAKINIRLARLIEGNFGDSKSLGSGIRELRIDWGPRYRVYYAMKHQTCVLLLCGGDKRKQSADIERAVRYWEDYKRRAAKP
jgi:putative addiction module killer protein